MPRPQRKGSGRLPGLEDGRDRRHGNAVQPIVQGAERGDRRFRGTSYRLLLVHDRQTEHRRRRSVAVPPDVRRGARRTEYPIRSLSGRSEPRMAAGRSGHRDARAGDGHAAPPYGLPLCKDRDAGPFVVRFRHYRHAVYRRNVGERHARRTGSDHGSHNRPDQPDGPDHAERVYADRLRRRPETRPTAVDRRLVPRIPRQYLLVQEP